ncbi:MAG: hypothetical protein HY852_19455 [Bradyrhizobium sp.]|uniref:hypothetical protein n=1 Tax=Bradyrhizobium sp. TaxID=376 RepID=UPI0025BE37ED|nr:hypothetical protein [Bradyrhizobium sp.]MBI5263988.1 hypothetical protein [Bradyrhizobium sp.]
MRRQIVRPFTERQIEPISIFADQAVIAIVIVRPFEGVQARTEELRESLKQQTVTADVLKVIGRSTFALGREVPAGLRFPSLLQFQTRLFREIITPARLCGGSSESFDCARRCAFCRGEGRNGSLR